MTQGNNNQPQQKQPIYGCKPAREAGTVEFILHAQVCTECRPVVERGIDLALQIGELKTPVADIVRLIAHLEKAGISVQQVLDWVTQQQAATATPQCQQPNQAPETGVWSALWAWTNK